MVILARVASSHAPVLVLGLRPRTIHWDLEEAAREEARDLIMLSSRPHVGVCQRKTFRPAAVLC